MIIINGKKNSLIKYMKNVIEKMEGAQQKRECSRQNKTNMRFIKVARIVFSFG